MAFDKDEVLAWIEREETDDGAHAAARHLIEIIEGGSLYIIELPFDDWTDPLPRLLMRRAFLLEDPNRRVVYINWHDYLDLRDEFIDPLKEYLLDRYERVH